MPLANALPLLIQATVSGIVMIRCYGELVSLYSLSTYTQITPLTVFLVQLLYVSITPLNTGLLLVLFSDTSSPTPLQWNRNKWILAFFLALQAAQSAVGAWLVASYIQGESTIYIDHSKLSADWYYS